MSQRKRRRKFHQTRKIRRKVFLHTTHRYLNDFLFWYFREFFENSQIIVDQILFDEMETVQQQWQQFVMLTTERELHFHSSETKKRNKLKKFTRTKEFFLAYDSLFDFEGMRHWCPTQI